MLTILFFKKCLNSDLFVFCLYRILSVFLVNTSFVPDEYWQSLEVSHKMVFGYGHLTWEWKHGLRSYIYPFIFAVLYKLLQFLEMDTRVFLTLVPRLFQALLTALSDYYFYHLCKAMGCKSMWIKTFIFTNWFWYFCGSRTVLNMFETSLTIIALYHYPWDIVTEKYSKNQPLPSSWNYIVNQSLKYLPLVIMVCIVRPTAVTIWAPLVFYMLLKLHISVSLKLIIFVISPLVASLLCVSILIDYMWYEKFVFPPYNFFMSNILSGVASFYGTHPYFWYVTQGIPAVLGFHLLPFTFGCFTIMKTVITKYQQKSSKIFGLFMEILIFNISILSMIPHKEFRFILPLLPLMEIIAIKFMSDFQFLNVRKRLISWWTKALFLGFVIPALLFGMLHQRATLTVMGYLSDEARQNPVESSFLFLTPCHSTPLYSHLHMNVPIRFLTCEPPLTPTYRDESDEFFREPRLWIENNWNSLGNISHVVFFDSIAQSISSLLRDKGFTLRRTFLHTILAGSSAGDNILVYGR